MDDGKWHEGSYMALSETTYCLKEDYDRHPDNTKHFIVFDRMTDWGLPNRHLQSEVVPATVGQYTGLTDKNGKRIFEGDIVFDAFENHYGVVAYGDYKNPFNSDEWTHNFGFSIDWKTGNGPDLLRKDLGYWITEVDARVVGNIHDNPDLIEAETGVEPET